MHKVRNNELRIKNFKKIPCNHFMKCDIVRFITAYAAYSLIINNNYALMNIKIKITRLAFADCGVNFTASSAGTGDAKTHFSSDVQEYAKNKNFTIFITKNMYILY